MRKNNEQINILPRESFRVEEFAERVCDRNNLYYYFGSISIVLSTAFNMINKDVIIGFEQCVGGVCFTITCENEEFKDLDFNKEESSLKENMLLIKMLTDEVNVVNNGKSLEMIFYVDGVEPELLKARQENIRAYSNRIKILK